MRSADEMTPGEFAEAVDEFPARQGLKVIRVAEHRAWLPVTSNEVLALRQVDGRLTANARIRLGKERGGNVHHRHAPMVERRREADDVGRGAAPAGDDCVLAAQSELGETLT